MATDRNTGGIRPVTLPEHFPPMPAVARILSRFDREALHGFIAVAIDLADAMDGDPDLEDDSEDRAFDEAEPDMRSYRGHGPGCPIADEDKAVDDDYCDEADQDLERDSLQDDVPALRVYSLDLDDKTGERVFLGYSNLLSSFVAGGKGVLSADSGRLHTSRPQLGTKPRPGAPV